MRNWLNRIIDSVLVFVIYVCYRVNCFKSVLVASVSSPPVWFGLLSLWSIFVRTNYRCFHAQSSYCTYLAVRTRIIAVIAWAIYAVCNLTSVLYQGWGDTAVSQRVLFVRRLINILTIVVKFYVHKSILTTVTSQLILLVVLWSRTDEGVLAAVDTTRPQNWLTILLVNHINSILGARPSIRLVLRGPTRRIISISTKPTLPRARASIGAL